MNSVKRSMLFAIVSGLFFACGHRQDAVETLQDLIEITNQQFATDSMHLGEMETRTFHSTVTCSGTIVPLPHGIATIHAPVAGVVTNIYCSNGQYVDKHQTLLEIGGSEIIDIQKEVAEAAAAYKRSKTEYDRIKSLFNEKVTSEKDFIVAESEYKTALARYHGLRMKMELIGFSITNIENDEFYSTYSIKAPISGYITNLNANMGRYIDSQSELIEIIDPTLFQVQLSVFATDINKLKKGQTVRFRSINSLETHSATLSFIGVSVDHGSKSIDCYASITDDRVNHGFANEFVEAVIVTNVDTVEALPTESVIKTEAGYYILALEKKEADKYIFRKVEVNIGRQEGGYTEILGKRIDHRIATKGVYNISL